MAKSWTDSFDEYREIASDISESVRLTTKDSRFWRAVAWGLFLGSFGGFSRQRFLEDFATTLGPIQAYPAKFKTLSRTLIAHESRHTSQFLLAGWFVPIIGWLGPRVRVWAGFLPMMLIYGLFPLPVFFAWGRFELELDADAYSWKVALQRGWLTPDQVRARAKAFAQIVSSWSYLKAWPTKWCLAAFQRRADEVIQQWQSTDSSVDPDSGAKAAHR